MFLPIDIDLIELHLEVVSIETHAGLVGIVMVVLLRWPAANTEESEAIRSDGCGIKLQRKTCAVGAAIFNSNGRGV